MDEYSVGKILKIPKAMLEELKDYQVIMGFAGFGNIGYLTLSHIIETTSVKSFSFWGNHSWYYRENLESTLTAYIHEESKSIIITTRLPIFVSAMTNQFWTGLVSDILEWNCRRYIVIGGLKEETRLPQSTDWAAFVPTTEWTEQFGHKRSFADKLTMIGPLSSLLMLGTSMKKPVMGLLAYCNLEEDPDASLYALEKIEQIAGIKIPEKKELKLFDFTFLSTGGTQNGDLREEDDSDGYDNYDIDDLL